MPFQKPSFVGLVTIGCCLLVCPGAVGAQEGKTTQLLDKISWAAGPITGELGRTADVGVPANCRFTDADGAKLFLEATQNPSGGNELGVLLCQAANDRHWFAVFTFANSGFVRDDEKTSLDQNAVLKQIQRGTEAGNSERRRRGWEEIEVLGWERAPYYDKVTHNLTWATRLKGKDTPESTINHSVRLLGRRGVMHADLVADQEGLAEAVAAFDSVLTNYTYVEGERYAEWRDGDKVAEYGLTALIAGGAGVAAAKLGLFGKAWKVILGLFIALKKLIIVAVVGAVAFLKRLFGKKESTSTATDGAA